MIDRQNLVSKLQQVATNVEDRRGAMKLVADLLRNSGGYRWVGLYDVDRAAGLFRNVVWSGFGSPEYPTFPITEGLTGAAVAGRKTINVGDVTSDPRYLTAFCTTRAEIIVPVFDSARENVVGTIDIESVAPNAFDNQTQELLETCSDLIGALWQR
jgi:GAF domain-containing protein